MFRSKLVVGIIAAAATVGLSGVALANGGTYDPGYSTPAPMSTDNGAGFYLGLQAGYGLTHWNNLQTQVITSVGSVSNENGFAGRVFAGYMFNKFLGLEAGWAYLPSQVKMKPANSTGQSITVKNWAADLSGVFVVPLQDQFGIFTKVGLGYLASRSAPNLVGSSSSNLVTRNINSWNVAYGAGLYYDITPQIRATAAWQAYTGHPKLDSSYQPNPDLFLVGLQYRFASDFFSGM